MSSRASSGIDDRCETVDWPDLSESPASATREYNGKREGSWEVTSSVGSFIDDRCPTVYGYPQLPPPPRMSNVKPLSAELCAKLLQNARYKQRMRAEAKAAAEAEALAREKEKPVRKENATPEKPPKPKVFRIPPMTPIAKPGVQALPTRPKSQPVEKLSKKEQKEAVKIPTPAVEPGCKQAASTIAASETPKFKPRLCRGYRILGMNGEEVFVPFDKPRWVLDRGKSLSFSSSYPRIAPFTHDPTGADKRETSPAVVETVHEVEELNLLEETNVAPWDPSPHEPTLEHESSGEMHVYKPSHDSPDKLHVYEPPAVRTTQAASSVQPPQQQSDEHTRELSAKLFTYRPPSVQTLDGTGRVPPSSSHAVGSARKSASAKIDKYKSPSAGGSARSEQPHSSSKHDLKSSAKLYTYRPPSKRKNLSPIRSPDQYTSKSAHKTSRTPEQQDWYHDSDMTKSSLRLDVPTDATDDTCPRSFLDPMQHLLMPVVSVGDPYHYMLVPMVPLERMPEKRTSYVRSGSHELSGSTGFPSEKARKTTPLSINVRDSQHGRTIFAGTGWISPHPLSTVVSEVEPAINLQDEDGFERTLTYEEWQQLRRDVSQRGSEQRDPEAVRSKTSSGRTSRDRQSTASYRSAPWMYEEEGSIGSKANGLFHKSLRETSHTRSRSQQQSSASYRPAPWAMYSEDGDAKSRNDRNSSKSRTTSSQCQRHGHDRAWDLAQQHAEDQWASPSSKSTHKRASSHSPSHSAKSSSESKILHLKMPWDKDTDSYLD